MTTFPLQAGSSIPTAHKLRTQPELRAASDLMALTSDMDSLAQHMQHCAMARGKWSRTQRVIESTHSLVLPRIVTVAAFLALMTVATTSVAVILGWAAAV